MMKKRVLAGMVAAATMSFFTPLSSYAFGLGNIDVKSALNEPFKAEIELTALRPGEKENLQVKLASDAEFTRAGLNRSMLLNQMQFDIIESQGRDKILITSKNPIKEPFLDFLITASAGSGVLIREYTVLLDPPEYVTNAMRGGVASADERVVGAVSDQTESTYYPAIQESSYSSNQYKVKRSDTLWTVAQRTRPGSDISVHQMMMALLNANPEAFTDHNVNGLIAGRTLRVPSRAKVQAMSEDAARAAFAEQNAAWKNRHRTTNTTAQTVLTSSDTGTAADEQTGNTRAEDSQETADESMARVAEVADTDDNLEGHLQLVAPEDVVTSDDDASPNVKGNDELEQLAEQLTLAQETIEAQKQENIDFRARMDAMEEQLETMRRLISIKDADLARMQSLLEEDGPTLAEQTTLMPEPGQDAPDSMDSSESAETAPDEPQTGTAVSNGLADSQSENAATGADAISRTAEALNLDAEQVQSTLGKVRQFVTENKIPTALGGLLVLLLLWLWVRRSRREVTWDEAVRQFNKADEDQNVSAAVVSPAEHENITDAPLDEEQADQEKSVSDLVEQADMFVGYADYVQARASLEKARQLEPDNRYVAYKMLFVLYKQGQADEFIALAEAVPFETESAEWSEIRQWGRELAPEHALFAEPEAEATSVIDEPQLEETSDSLTPDEDDTIVDIPTTSEVVADSGSDDSGSEVGESEQSDHIEFDLEQFRAEESGQKTETEADDEQTSVEEPDDDLLAFDTRLDLDETVAPLNTDDDSEVISLDINDTDEEEDSFSLDDEELQPAPAPLELDEQLPSLDENELSIPEDDSDLQFDIGDLDTIDEVETKLDLAAAYIDMGDPDGARSILNEVLAEGDEEQKTRASELLDSLS